MKYRLPAFAKELISLRDRGIHPLVVHVILGREWDGGRRLLKALDTSWKKAPVLCVRPDQNPQVLDWTPVIGLHVKILELEGDAGELAVEIARFAAPVEIWFRAKPADWPWAPANSFHPLPYPVSSYQEWLQRGHARGKLTADARQPSPNWTDELAADYQRRLASWLTELCDVEQQTRDCHARAA